MNPNVHALVESFNSKIRILARDLAQQYPNDATIGRAQKRTNTVTALSPLFVIDSVGPYLYRYRDKIYSLEKDNSAVEFFMENTYDTELKAGVNTEKVDLVMYIIPKAKESARALPPGAMADYTRLVVDLLDIYIEYLAAPLP